MEEKILMTYALLSHLKESHNSKTGSLLNIFEPIVKKAIMEYAFEKGSSIVMGKNISELQEKIKSYFGINLPNGVLTTILRRISDEINDENLFVFHREGSFIIKSYVFHELDKNIKDELSNIELLKNDYKSYCSIYGIEYDFNQLLDFIFALELELFDNRSSNVINTNYNIPKYLKEKLNDKEIYGIISDLYLGNIINSYLSLNIVNPVTNTELLIDTNYFISLIDLNTEEAFSTCTQLYRLCNRLGFKFTILQSTVEQIRILLNSRIQDFANKEIGLIKQADIFAACIRRSLDKTQLERIKDSIFSRLKELSIEIISEARIQPIIDEAKNSQKYQDMIEIRNGNRLSALNDTVAHYYVKNRRGKNISEFSEVKCWFLHNSYYGDYESNLKYKIHERFTINANELLTLLWLTNPSQENISADTISKGGLATYIAKYRCIKMPSNEIIKNIHEKVKIAQNDGKVNEKDVYAIGVRMAEGHLSSNEAEQLVTLPNEEFITAVKKYTKEDDQIKSKLTMQGRQISKIKNSVQHLSADNLRLKKENAHIRFNTALSDYQNGMKEHIEIKTASEISKIKYKAYKYLAFLLVTLILYLAERIYGKIAHPLVSSLIAGSLFVITISILWFIEHTKVKKYLTITFLKDSQTKFLKDLKKQYASEYESLYKKPKIEDFYID